MRSASGSWLRERADRITIALLIASAALLSLPLQPASRAATGEVLRIYVSLPQKGANADTTGLITKGLKAAMRAQRHRIGGKRLRLVELNDARGARWHPRLVRRNARRAVNDPAAIAYVGELNSEATAVAKPIIERSGMAMFAPVATADSLTDSAGSGSSSAGTRALFRAIPNDSAQAVALITYLRRSNVRRFVMVDDGALYGRGLADSVAKLARKQSRLRLLGRHRAHRDGKGRHTLVRRIAAQRPQAVLFAGSQSSDAAPLFRALHRKMPKALLFGGDALAHDSFARQIGKAQEMARMVRPSSHTDPRNNQLRRLLGYRPDPVTVFAFDGMKAILGAIRRAEAAGTITSPAARRAAVRNALFGGRLVRGAVGLWKIRPNGDSSNGVFDAIRMRGGRAVEPAELAARRHLRREKRARSSSVNPTDPSLLTSMDIETMLRMVQEERVRLLNQQIVEQIKAVQQQNEAIRTLNELAVLINRLREYFPANASPDSRLSGVPGWSDIDSGIRLLTVQISTNPFLNLVTDSDDAMQTGTLTQADLDHALGRIQNELDRLHSAQQTDMLRLQSLSNKRNEVNDVLSNLNKKMGDNRSSIIANMR